MQITTILGVAVVALATGMAHVAPALAEWSPSGPIKLIIAFRAGGGTDTQARMLAEEIETRRGWKIIPENVTGKGGSNMARVLKGAPADGLTVGMAVTETFSYIPVASEKAGYTAEDFTFLTTTAPTQMGIVARADKGWKTIDDMLAAAKASGAVSFATMSPRLEDGAFYMADHFGVTFNTVSVKGGKGALNAIVAGDVDVGWVAGIQTKGVKAGELVNLASGESARLAASPDAPTVGELGIPFSFGATFVMVAPAGLPVDARDAFASAVAEVVADGDSKTHQFIAKGFGPPLIVSGEALDKMVSDEIADNEAMLAKIAQ